MKSVFDQDCSAVEYVVIDGGSSDGTVGIIEGHADKLSYWHSMPDRGIGHAFNLGVRRCRGEWILFLNADDFLCNKDALRNLASHAQGSKVDVVYGQIQPVSRDANPQFVSGPAGWPYSPWAFLFRDLISHPAALTSRAYFDKVGPFREDLRIAVDYELYLRQYRTLRTVLVPEVFTHMRVGGLSHDRKASIEEMLQAQILNRVLPPSAHAIFRSFVRSKAAVGRVIRSFPKRSGKAES